AMLAVAARVGAPLGHDFCALSLSDNLKPWPVIERRLDAAAQAGFVIALYNPISRARPWQLAAAFERLRRYLPATTPTVFGRAVGRADENVAVTTLQAADPAGADMATVVIVGSAETRLGPRPGPPLWRIGAGAGGRVAGPRPRVAVGAPGRPRGRGGAAQKRGGGAGRAPRRVLAVGRPPAAIFGDDEVDRVGGQQCPVVG